MSEFMNQDMLNRAYRLCSASGYVLQDFVAKGGYGVVHYATRSSDGLKCAAKICPYVHNFTREVKQRTKHFKLILCVYLYVRAHTYSLL